MFNGDETIWVNQKEFQYKDVEFGSASMLDIATSINTKDFKYFSYVTLNFSITSDSDRTRRSCNLQIQEVKKLFNSFREVSKDYEEAYYKNSEISLKVGDRYLEFKYKESTSGTRCVIIIIAYSENDYGRVIVPLEDFETIIHIFSTFFYGYQNFRKELKDQIVNHKIAETNLSIERGIRLLPSSISIGGMETPTLDTETKTPSDEQDLLKDFEKHIDESLEKPLEEEKKIQAEEKMEVIPDINSSFIKDTLKLDLANYERILVAASGEYNSTQAVIDRLKESMSLPKDFMDLPGISEKDYKSTLYISRFNYLTAFKLYIRDKSPVPISMPPIKYKPDHSKVHSSNVELAYDLLVISAYLKNLTQKIAQKNADSQENKALFYYAHRCFTDILCFSFLDEKDADIIKNCVLSRFRDYEKAGFFAQYQNLLFEKTCTPISEKDIYSFLDLLVQKVLPSKMYVDDFHSKLFEDRLLVPPSNNISLEQIINEVVKINVLHCVNELNIYEVDLAQLNQIIDSRVSPEVFDILRTPKSTRKQVEKVKYTSNLHWYFNKYRGDLPKGEGDKLVEYFKVLGENDFPFNNPPVNLEDLDERYVRALYHHNNLEGSKRNLDRNGFVTYIHDSCDMTKRDILDKYKAEEESSEKGESTEQPATDADIFNNISWDL